MKEEGGNWFSKWEAELPSPEELIPLSQTLISPDLALAFDIRSSATVSDNNQGNRVATPPPPPSSAAAVTPSPNSHLATPQPNSSADFGADSSDMGSGAAGDEPARTLKRPRLVWTPQLHKRFVDAVGHLGIKNAVPKTIMQLMSVDGLTRENVASHLQKYRLYLKRMQGLSGNGGGGGGGGSPRLGISDPAAEHLFTSSTVPPHFLHHPVRPSSEHFLPFVPVAALQHHHHHHHHHHQQPQMHLQGHYHRGIGQFEHAFLPQRVGINVHNSVHKVDDLESASGNGGRKVLTLFPTGDD